MGNCLGLGEKKKHTIIKEPPEKQKHNQRIHKWLEDNQKFASEVDLSHYSVDDPIPVVPAPPVPHSHPATDAISLSTEAVSSISTRQILNVPNGVSPSARRFDRLRDERQSCYYTASEKSVSVESQKDRMEQREEVIKMELSEVRKLLDESQDDTEYLTTDEGDIASPSLERRGGSEKIEMDESQPDNSQLSLEGVRLGNERTPQALSRDYAMCAAIVFDLQPHDPVTEDDQLSPLAEDENERILEHSIQQIPFEKRPVRAMPTPLRNNILSPRKLEMICDNRGRVRQQNSRVKEYIDKKRAVLT